MDLRVLLTQYKPLLILLAWFFISHGIAWLSGWKALAKLYSGYLAYTEKKIYFQSAQFRWGVNYNGILIVGANTQGLYLSVLFLLRPGHSSLFIPWTEIRSEIRQGIFPSVILRFTRQPKVFIMIPKRLGEMLQEMSLGQFKL